MKTPSELYDALHETDEGTWVTHWVQAFSFFLLGAIRSFDLGGGLAFGAFAHREIAGFAKAVRQLGWRQAIRKKLFDGIGDLLFAVEGLVTGLLWHVGGVWALAGGLAVSAGTWAMMAAVARRKRKQEGGR